MVLGAQFARHGAEDAVPTGSICGLISTAALLSKRMTEPSARRMSFADPHHDRLHHLALLDAAARRRLLTETTITSPIVAYFRFEPPSTLMHMTRRAPELSATSRLVCIWIIDSPVPLP